MTKLIKITGGCLKCRFLKIVSSLLEREVYCQKDYEYPHIKDRSKYVGHCDHLDYDDKSCARWDKRLAFCRSHARDRLVLA